MLEEENENKAVCSKKKNKPKEKYESKSEIDANEMHAIFVSIHFQTMPVASCQSPTWPCLHATQPITIVIE